MKNYLFFGYRKILKNQFFSIFLRIRVQVEMIQLCRKKEFFRKTEKARILSREDLWDKKNQKCTEVSGNIKLTCRIVAF